MNITIYTTKTCAYCAMVKQYLTSKGKEYKVVDLTDEPDIRQDLLNKTGAMTVPITEIDGDYIVGWQPGKLAAAIA